MTLSAAITAAGGCFYAQYFLFLDAGIAYGPWISVEALLAPIIGGIGTVFGPLLGALVVRSLGELTKLVTGHAPGLDLVIYGAVLVLVVAFAPRGIAGLFDSLRAQFRDSLRSAAWLSCCASKTSRAASAGCSPSTRASFTADDRPHHRADRPERRRQDHAVRDHHRLPRADRRPRVLRRRRHHRPAAASAGAARHRAHVPDRAAVRRPDRAGEHRGRLASLAAVARRCARGGRGCREGRRPRADARSSRLEPHGRGAQAAGACARARDRAEAAAARRGAGRPQPVRGARHGAGDPARSARAASPS